MPPFLLFDLNMCPYLAFFFCALSSLLGSSKGEGSSAYSHLVDLVQVSTINLNHRLREMSDRIYLLEKAAVINNRDRVSKFKL